MNKMGKRLADFIVNKSEDELYEDSRSMVLTHYVMAERVMQVEYWGIRDSMFRDMTDDNLIYILEGGFKGFHNFEPSELIKEYEEVEDQWYELYESGSLPWPVFEDDPIHALEEDENGEVAHA